MKIPEHLAMSFLIAQLGVHPIHGWGGTTLVLLAGCLPDLDGLTLLAGWRVYRRYHRVIGHGIPMTVLGPLLVAALGSEGFGVAPFLPLWFWLQVSLVAHLLSDVLFYRWPAQLLWPCSSWSWALGLVGWNDLIPTVILYGASLAAVFWPQFGWAAGVSGLGMLGIYLTWRCWRQPGATGWSAWLAGDWAEDAAPIWRWLTGDFVP